MRIGNYFCKGVNNNDKRYGCLARETESKWVRETKGRGEIRNKYESFNDSRDNFTLCVFSLCEWVP
jgi:hypothetical protein